ncbi:hypothetical protein BDU57DRAFT_213727 [Ampelomyces quisqualis]|uniref:F-box domain-containing protein n=1 Tax=Ampelomyces quisqualis TaxID=50730 RepID=A0A6A5QMZ2_AMPQU|nr:hypothetical protein BDU57DRAFT_213727 [Ampelomyces quisqualis]
MTTTHITQDTSLPNKMAVHSPFLNLPAELRQIIFEKVFRYDNGLLVDFYPNLRVVDEGSLSLLDPNKLKYVNWQLHAETKGVLLRVNDTLSFGELDTAVYYARGGMQKARLDGPMANSDRALYLFAHFADILKSPKFRKIKHIHISIITSHTSDFLDHLTTVFLKDHFKRIERFCNDNPKINVYLALTSPTECAYTIEEELEVVSKVMNRLRGHLLSYPSFNVHPALGITEFSMQLDVLTARLAVLHAALKVRLAGYRRILPQNLRVKIRMASGVYGRVDMGGLSCSRCQGTGNLDHFSELYPNGC